MLLHALVLSVFAIGMAAVIILSCMGASRKDEQARDLHEEPGEPEELRAAA